MDGHSLNIATSNVSQASLRAAMAQAKADAQTAERAGNAKNLAAIDAAAKEFESVFLSEMLKPMFEGVETDENFGGGKGEEVFRGFMIKEYGKMMVNHGGIGIAEKVKAEMLRIQEGSGK